MKLGSVGAMSLALVARGDGTWWTLVGNNFGKSQEAAQKQNAVGFAPAPACSPSNLCDYRAKCASIAQHSHANRPHMALSL